MKIGLIGRGAIARFADTALTARGHDIAAVLVRGDVDSADARQITSVTDLPADLDLVIDCAGHAALAEHGPGILQRGLDLVTVSIGALADDALWSRLNAAAVAGQSRLHLATGAIGALDALQAAAVGTLHDVIYTGRKPPAGWAGSAAEDRVDLAALRTGQAVHFDGTARDAALKYPKNANVAAAVALAGLGFDRTNVQLIADADITENIHEVQAVGDFGSFSFRIAGHALPDNPKSSALAAMSVVAKVDALSRPITL